MLYSSEALNSPRSTKADSDQNSGTDFSSSPSPTDNEWFLYSHS
nr:MAG TPA: hypothetical protein [Caudoviricetes sp.]